MEIDPILLWTIFQSKVTRETILRNKNVLNPIFVGFYTDSFEQK